MSVIVGGGAIAGGSQGRLANGAVGSSTGPKYQPEVVQPRIVVQQARMVGKFRRAFNRITYDSTGAPLAACSVDLFMTPTDVKVDSAVSDANGGYEMSAYADGPYYVVCYKAGSPDVAGTSVNTLNGE